MHERAEEFCKYVETFPDCTRKTLLLAHSMCGDTLHDITKNPMLVAKKREEYNDEALCFFYYGRPAYRPNNSIKKAVPNTLLHPMAFLLDPHEIGPIKRIMPFDSGAIHNELLQEHTHPNSKKEHFEIGDDIISAKKLVSGFFGSNMKYLKCLPNKDVEVPQSNLSAHYYYDLISSKTPTEVDDRKSAIEIQYGANISVNSKTVKAVIICDDLMQDKNIEKFLKDQLKLKDKDIRKFIHIPCQPGETARVIIDKALEYYTENGV